MKKGIGFGNESVVEETHYIGEWVIIYPHGINTNFYGKVKAIDGNYAILNPFGGTIYVRKGDEIVQERALIEGNSRIPLINAAIEPTMKSSLENSIQFHNKPKKETNSK